MHFYLSGPMRNRPNFNRASFEFYASQLAERGHTTFSPWTDDGMAHSSGVVGSIPQDELVEFMDRDMRAIAFADAVFLMPGWQNSRGCNVEVAYAHYLGKPVIDFDGNTHEFKGRHRLFSCRPDGEPAPIIALPPYWQCPEVSDARAAAGVL